MQEIEQAPPLTQSEEMLTHQRYIARRLYEIQVGQARHSTGIIRIAVGVFLGMTLWALVGWLLTALLFGATIAGLGAAAQGLGGH